MFATHVQEPVANFRVCSRLRVPPSSTAIGGLWGAEYDAHCTDVVADYNFDTQEVYSSRLRALNLRWLS